MLGESVFAASFLADEIPPITRHFSKSLFPAVAICEVSFAPRHILLLSPSAVLVSHRRWKNDHVIFNLLLFKSPRSNSGGKAGTLCGNFGNNPSKMFSKIHKVDNFAPHICLPH